MSPEVSEQIWARVLSMDAKIVRAARHCACQTGCEADEIAQVMRLSIAEALLRRPELGEKRDEYLVALGYNAYLGELRRDRRLDCALPLDDMENVLSSDPVSGSVIGEAVSFLSSDQKKVLAYVFKSLDDPRMIKRQSGRVNVSALAARMGQNTRTVGRRLDDLRAQLGALLW
jgi:hypothetical protein